MELKWLVGLGLGCAATVGALAFYLSDDGKAATVNSSSISREKLLEVLRELKKETMTAFVTVASFALNVKQSNPQVPDEDLKAILIEYSPFKDIIGKAEAKVYDKYDVTQADIQHSYETEFSADADVQLIVSVMKTDLENAFKGIQPTFTANLPSFFTPDFTLKLVATMFESNKLIVRSMMKKLQEAGVRPSKTDPRFIKATQEMEEAFDMAKEHIFSRNGLNELDEPAALLFNTAIQKYSKETPGFARSYDQIEQNYKETMEMIFRAQ